MNDKEFNTIILTGSNLGDPVRNLKFALNRIRQMGNVTGVSSIYRSPAWGFDSEHPFLNQGIRLETDLDPETQLSALLTIEKEAGRNRKNNGYEDRILDLDILFINDLVIHTSMLIVPHPRLHQRRFALLPLVELCPEFVHPVINKAIQQLLDECRDESDVEKLGSE